MIRVFPSTSHLCSASPSLIVARSSKEGTPWTRYWNNQMSLCDGFYSEKTTMHIQDPDSMSIASDGLSKSLPCYPSNVIHGHAASRGLDINRFSFGLDTGCVRSLVFIVTCPHSL